MNKEYETPEMQERYRDRLRRIIGKKFDTTMIFPLSQFEASFGSLWGHGLPEEKLTDEELIYRRKWEACRKNILNMGNTQKRNMGAELAQHSIVWNRYQTNFIVDKNTLGYIDPREEEITED